MYRATVYHRWLGLSVSCRESMLSHGRAYRLDLRRNVGTVVLPAQSYLTSFPCRPERLDPNFHSMLNWPMCVEFERGTARPKTALARASVAGFPRSPDGRPGAAVADWFFAGTKRSQSVYLGDWTKPCCDSSHTSPADVDGADDWWPNLRLLLRFHAPVQWRLPCPPLCDHRPIPTAVARRKNRQWPKKEDFFAESIGGNPFCCFAGWHWHYHFRRPLRRRYYWSLVPDCGNDDVLLLLPLLRTLSKMLQMVLLLTLPLLLLLLPVIPCYCLWSTSWWTVSAPIHSNLCVIIQ